MVSKAGLACVCVCLSVNQRTVAKMNAVKVVDAVVRRSQCFIICAQFICLACHDFHSSYSVVIFMISDH